MWVIHINRFNNLIIGSHYRVIFRSGVVGVGAQYTMASWRPPRQILDVNELYMHATHSLNMDLRQHHDSYLT